MNNQAESIEESEATDTGESAVDVEENTDDNGAKLSKIETRLLGALMEKQLATPDAYPLTVNSLISACNQKTNREPVTNYQQGEVVRSLRELESRSLVRYEMGARSERYEQRFTNQFSLSKKQQALIAMMMVRGPQTLSELYTRTQRLHEYTDRNDMEVSLERLTMGDEPLVVLIPKGAGQREDRYGHLLCGTPEMPASDSTAGRSKNGNGAHNSELRAELAALRAELDALYELTGHKKPSADE